MLSSPLLSDFNVSLQALTYRTRVVWFHFYNVPGQTKLVSRSKPGQRLCCRAGRGSGWWEGSVSGCVVVAQVYTTTVGANQTHA